MAAGVRGARQFGEGGRGKGEGGRLSREGGDPRRRPDRGERDRRRRGPRGDARRAARRQARGARQQGSPRDGGGARHRGRTGGRRGDRAGRFRAQRRAAVHHRPQARRARAPHPDGVGRAVPDLDAGAPRRSDGGRGAAAPHVENGQEDHRGLRHTGQQGAGGDRGALPVRAALPGDPGGRAPPIRGARVRRVRGWLGARPGRLPHDGAAHSLRVDPSRAGARPRREAVRPGGGGCAHLRAGEAGALSRLRPRAGGGGAGRDGAGGVQRRKRGGGAALPRGADPVRQDRGDDRARAGGTLAVQRAEPGGRALRGRRGASPSAGGGVLLTLAALAVVLGPLIFVHEMGHFLAAKAVGVQVLRFSIGFGRPLWRRRWGETEYWLSLIPLGGYVKLATLEEEGPAGALEGGAAAVPIDPARVIESKSVPARLVLMLAGVTMNALLAFV